MRLYYTHIFSVLNAIASQLLPTNEAGHDDPPQDRCAEMHRYVNICHQQMSILNLTPSTHFLKPHTA